jgi:hypothetical protein
LAAVWYPRRDPCEHFQQLRAYLTLSTFRLQDFRALVAQWFRPAWAASGKYKLDLGKAGVRFKKLEDAALDVIGESIRRMAAQHYIERYRALIAATPKGSRKNAA